VGGSWDHWDHGAGGLEHGYVYGWILTQTKEAVKDQTKKQIVSRLSLLPFFSVFVLWAFVQ
jgi:hypothetical protein